MKISAAEQKALLFFKKYIYKYRKIWYNIREELWYMIT